MKNKKVLLIAAALLASMTLAGCDEIIARPTNETNYQTLVSGSTVAHNDVSWIYDEYHNSGSTPEKVKEALFEVLEETLFGKFSINDNGDITIEGFDGKSDADKLAFVKAHKPYWSKGAVAGSKKYEYVEPTSLTSEILNRIDIFKQRVKEEVIVTLFNRVNTESYKYRGKFYEIKFARNLAKNQYHIGDFTTDQIFSAAFDQECNEFTNNVLLDNSFSTENVDTIVRKDNPYAVFHLGYYDEYINKEILPSIMQTLLVSQYVYDNQYTAISRSQSRYVKYIAIETNNENVSAARRLFNTFVNDYIVDSDKCNANTEINYDLLGEAWKGVMPDIYNFETDEGNEVYDLLIKANFDREIPMKNGEPVLQFANGQTLGELSYLKNTKYGDLIEQFAEISLNPHENNTSTESSFSGSNAYSLDVGLELKTNEIRCNDFTVSDWGTKSNGFSSLASDIKNKVFDFTTMSDFESSKYSDSVDEHSYITKINGHYFIKADLSETSDPASQIVIKEGSTFYICELIEAPTQASLTIDENFSTDDEKLARQIGYEVASSSTYKTAAFAHYLEACDIVYHDQKVYDYFVSNYPEVFHD